MRPRRTPGSQNRLAGLHRALIEAQGGAEIDLGDADVPVDFSGQTIAAAKAVIRDGLAPLDAIQTLGAMVAYSVFGVAETYSEAQSVPSARIEYIASTLLERDHPTGLRVMTAEETNRAAGAIQHALDAADEIGRSTIFTVLSKAESAGDPMRRIAAHLQLVDSAMRGPGFEHQAKELIADLFSDPALETALTRTLGFTAAQAVSLEEAVSRLSRERMNDTLRTIELLTNQPQEAAFQLQRRGEHILAFTTDELSDATGLTAVTSGAFLERFSVRFDSGERAHLLSGRSTIRKRPFVAASDGRYLSTSPVNLLWALQPAFEDALKDEAEWQTFQQRRAAFVEHKIVGALADATRADARFANLRFSVDGGALYEIDGIVIVDDVCFVLEAKAGRLSETARRGRLRALRPELERLLGRGASQAGRLRKAILEGAPITFVERDGAPVEVPLAEVGRVEACIVTLEDFGWLVGLHREIVEAGIVVTPEDIPWIVSVFDFELVCRLIEFPAQLTLYLEDRRALPDQVSGGDEMNLWMVHQENKLKFPSDAGRVSLRGDWTEEIDRHFMFGYGDLPRMPLSRRTRQEVGRLDRERRVGHLRQTEALISRDQETRVVEPAVVMRRRETKISVYAKNR
jgi:hypothetical protein